VKPDIRAGMKASDALGFGSRYLRSFDIPDPATDARVLLAHVFGVNRSNVAQIYDDLLSETVTDAYRAALFKRAERAPVSHITGQREFYGRVFKVGPSVLDPRPETELLIDVALEQEFNTILDLGIGSGSILLTLLHERRWAWGVGIEKSRAAWRVAAENRDAMDLAGRAVLRQGDWYDGVQSGVEAGFPGFDLIVSNPPYISASEMDALQPEVRDHEPRMALTDGGDGLGAYRAICAGVMDHLASGGRLIVEIGPMQAASVSAFFAAAGLQNIEVRDDLDGRNRVVIGRKTGDNAT